MKTNNSTHEITIDSDEAYNIACDIMHSLESSVNSHWVNHPNTWKDQEKGRIERMRFFYRLAHCPRAADNAIKRFDKIINKANSDD